MNDVITMRTERRTLRLVSSSTMPPKSQRGKRGKKDEPTDPIERYWKKNVDLSLLKPPCGLASDILNEVNSRVPPPRGPGITPTGKHIQWLEIECRSERDLQLNIPSSSPPVRRNTLIRCWTAVRNEFVRDMTQTENHITVNEVLHFLRRHGEWVKGDLWRTIHQLLYEYYGVEGGGHHSTTTPEHVVLNALRRPPLPPAAEDIHSLCTSAENAQQVHTVLQECEDMGVLVPSAFPDHKGDTPLAIAAMHGHLEMVYLILQGDALVEAPNKTGDTALHLAASNGHHRICELLVAAGAQVACENTFGETPLHMACRAGHKTVAQYFIGKGAPLDFPTRGGFTPLHYAASGGTNQANCMSVMQLLLESGANHHAMTSSSHTPLLRAHMTKNKEAVLALASWRGPESQQDKKGKNAKKRRGR